jgi:hypothetical protein
MKKHFIFFASLGLLLSGCVTVSYFGDKLEPTSHVDIFYAAHDVMRNYKVIGHLACNNFSQEKVKLELTDYAKKIGADAIIITGTDATKNDQAAVINADALKYTDGAK